MDIDELFDTGKPIMNTPKRPAPETIVLTENRDHLHPQLMDKVRLNRYDMKFMVNIAEKYIMQGLPLSSGQNDLYEKIVHKYRKQLRKLKVNYKDILALPWANGLVDPEVLHQQTFFRITDSAEMQLYFNFNKAHIDEIRTLIHDDDCQHLNRGIAEGSFGNGQKYNFNFTNTTKTWHGPFNVYLFKKLYDFVVSHNVKVEDSVTDVVNALNVTGSKEDWTPGLHLVGSRVYVSHITESMLYKLEDIDPEDLSASNIEKFARLGLALPENYAGIARFINGNSSTSKQDIKTVHDVNELKNYIDTCNRKTIFYMPELGMPRYQDILPDVMDVFSHAESWGEGSLMFSNDSSRGVTEDTPEEVDNFSNLGYNTLVTTIPLTSLLRAQSKTGKFALEADKVIYISLEEPT